MLESVYKSYRKKADEINWKDYTINELFFKYIEHENDDLSEGFFAGIVCRVWGYAGRLYLQCNKHVAFEECHDCVIDTIRYVLKKRVWEDKNSSLYNDPTAPDKAFHIALKRQRSLMLSKLNAFRRRSNFNTLSIDEAREAFNDATDGLLFNMESSEIDKIRIFISEYFDKGDILNGLLLDIICYNNYKDYSDKKMIKFLRELDINYYDYYNHYYKIKKETYLHELKKISNYSNKILKIKLKSLLHRLKREEMF